jgi:hypothetical protein
MKKRLWMTPHFRIAAAIVMALAIALPAAAQEQRGSVEGTVKDSGGAFIPGASVSIKGEAGTITTVSGVDGKYRFPSLRPGRYTLTATLSGMGSAKPQIVDVSLGDTIRADFALGPVKTEATVVVTGEAPLIDTKSAARYSSISAENITKVPKGRDFTSVVTLAPGANNETRGGGVAIDGATVSENRYIIDGVDTAQLVNGFNGKALVTDFIEEVQVKSSGYTAEFGGSTGGVINVLTKSGTNTFKGDVGVYFSGMGTGYGFGGVQQSPTDGRPTLRLDPTTSALVAQTITYPKDGYTRWEPGFSLGGPIVKDTLWFFGAYQPSIISQERTAGQGGGGSVTRTQDVTVQYIAANLSTQFADNFRGRVSFNNSYSTVKGLLPASLGNDPATSNYDVENAYPNYTVGLNLDYVASSSIFSGLRVGYYSQDQTTTGVPSEPRTIFNTSNIGYLDVPVALQRGTGFSSIPTNTATNFDLQTRLTAQLDGTFYFQAGGEHAVKVGGQYDQLKNSVLAGELGNRVTYRWNQSTSGQRGPYGYYSVRSAGPTDYKHGFATSGDQKEDVWGLFLQDTWTIARNFTLSLGVRTESEALPSYATGTYYDGSVFIPAPIKFNFGDKIAPRAGFAWDVKGDGKTKVYGSWGYFYDISKMNQARGSFGGEKWIEYYYTLDNYNWPTMVAGANCPPTCPGTLIKSVDFRYPSNFAGADPPGVDPNLKPYKLQEYSAGVEHELAQSMSVGLRYVHKNVIYAIEDLGGLDAAGNEIYVQGNPGYGFNTTCYTDPTLTVACPKAKREYDSVEATFNKRYADNWSLRFSYLWSRLHGNYGGLTSSDENGRNSPNTNRYFDYPFMGFNETGQQEFGPLPTDRPHQFKVLGAYTFPFGLTFGANYYLASGVPITREAGFFPPNNYPVQYAGRASDGRTPWYSQTDMNLAQDIRLSGFTITLGINVLNVFGQQIVTNKFNTQINGSGVTTTLAQFYRGIDTQALIASQHLVIDPRFGQAWEYQVPRTIRFQVKASF